MTNAEEEGIADQCDKADIPELSEEELAQRFSEASTRDYYRDYRRHIADGNHWIERVEKAIEKIADSSDSAGAEARRLMEEVPDNGRPLGAFMARTILNESGRQRLAGVAGDPFAFWLAYHEAATSSRGRARPLSEKSLGLLLRMQQTTK
jgi:hypothetical protein